MKLLSLFLSLLMVFNLSAAEAGKEYKLEKDDVVRMIVFQEPELKLEAQIGKSGYVSFPLIGNVKLVGKSLKDAEDEVKALYEKDYLVNAQVNLSILNYAEKWVVVGGEVRRPGTIKYPEEGALDLRGAIAQAGGVAETADASNIVVRSKAGAVKSYSLSSSGSVVLSHGDSVTVNPISLSRSTVTVSGSVNRPGSIEFPRQGGLDLITAIAQAGGYSRLADQKRVTVTRKGKPMALDIRAMREGAAPLFQLRPGDIVIVPESKW